MLPAADHNGFYQGMMVTHAGRPYVLLRGSNPNRPRNYVCFG
jgi:hypothetical protein